MIELGGRPSESPRPSRSRWAAEDIIPALNQRVAELESQLAFLQTDLEKEQKRLLSYSDAEQSLKSAVREAYRKADAIHARARAEADALMEDALRERRLLLSEVERLRRERDELHDEIASLRRDGLAPLPASPLEAPPMFDQPTAVMDAMRTMLLEILDEMRSRAIAPTISAAAAQVEIERPVPAQPRVETPAAIVAEPASVPTVEDVEDLARPGSPSAASALAAHSPPAIEPQTDESVVPPVQDAPEPTVEDVEDLARPEPASFAAPAAAAPIEPIIEERVEQLQEPVSLPSVAAPDEADVLSFAPSEPFVEEIDDFDEPDAAPPPSELETQFMPPPPVEALTDLSPIQATDPVEEFLGDVVSPEFPTEFSPVTDQAPPRVDADITALWDAALPVIEPIAPPALEPPAPEPAAPEEFTVSSSALPMPEAPAEPPQEWTPPSAPDATTAEPERLEPAVTTQPTVRQIQLVISPVHSFPRLLEIQARIATLSSVRGLQLRDFRNGAATFAVGVSEAITPLEFGAVLQMLESMRLRLEGTSQSSVEMRLVEDSPGS